MVTDKKKSTGSNSKVTLGAVIAGDVESIDVNYAPEEVRVLLHREETFLTFLRAIQNIHDSRSTYFKIEPYISQRASKLIPDMESHRIVQRLVGDGHAEFDIDPDSAAYLLTLWNKQAQRTGKPVWGTELVNSGNQGT